MMNCRIDIHHKMSFVTNDQRAWRSVMQVDEIRYALAYEVGKINLPLWYMGDSNNFSRGDGPRGSFF